ncbi:hypothetical protein ABIB83_003354 [Bradyrhizobium sp. I1.8.5]
MILVLPYFRSVIRLFDQLRHHSSVPTENCNAVARSGSPVRPNGRREAALPWAVASTVACLGLWWVSTWAVVPLLFALSIDCRFARADEQEVAHPTRGQTTGRFEHFVGEAAQRFAIPVQWIQLILRIESAGDARAKSDKGAIGLMQIMPATWTGLRLRYALGNDPYDPHDNILAGSAYLRELFDHYGFPGAFAAYNAGPVRYEQHLAGDTLPVETRGYVSRIVAELDAASASTSPADARLWLASPIFPAQSDRMGAAGRQQPTASRLHTPSVIVPKPTGMFVARLDAGEGR